MQQSARSAPRRGSRGYGKGDDTRTRLIEEALRIFGEHGYRAATTRELAGAASTTLPSLSYYFGGKEGLYVACAESVVERFERATGEAAALAQAELGRSLEPERAREHLKAIFRALVLLFTGRDAWRFAGFVRDVLDTPGPAFDVLYDRLWQPGIELTALLIQRAGAGHVPDGAAKVRAIMMISSLIGFGSGPEVVARAIGSEAMDTSVRPQVLAVLEDQIDQIRG